MLQSKEEMGVKGEVKIWVWVVGWMVVLLGKIEKIGEVVGVGVIE